MGDRLASLARYWLCFATFAALALSFDSAAATFVVNEPWAPPAAATRTTEVYANLTSSEGVTVVGVVSEAARGVAIRGTGTPGPILSRLPLPPGTTVTLRQGMMRIILDGLKRSLQPGDRIPLTLVIEDENGSRQEVSVDAEVRWRSPTDDHKRAHRQ